ncbi:MAG TPA: hypothetical protein VK530_00065 [Candidatus Acidoferrum sp.]|nr:hypothetical protein [Candidatus Acidoferrum sp.]
MTRNKTIRLRLSEDELGKLKSIAGKRGVSSLLRLSALALNHREQQAERLRLIGEVARIRNTLANVARTFELRPLLDQLHIVSRLIAIERELARLNHK